MKFVRSSYWGLKSSFRLLEEYNGGSEESKMFNATLVKVNGVKLATGVDFDGETGSLLKDTEDNVHHLKEEEALELIQVLAGEKKTAENE